MRWPSTLLICLVCSTTSDPVIEVKVETDPEVMLEIAPNRSIKPHRTTFDADYVDYVDYDLNAKLSPQMPSQLSRPLHLLSPDATIIPMKFEGEPELTQKARDEVSRLIGDLHSEEQLSRRTTAQEPASSTTPMSTTEGEGSGMEETSTRRTYTTLIQEVDEVPPTAAPDPYEHLDYDLTNHSTLVKPTKKKLKLVDNGKIHGGEIKKKTKKIFEKTVVSKPKKLKKLTRPDKKSRIRFLNAMIASINPKMRKVTIEMMKPTKPRHRVIVGGTSAIIMNKNLPMMMIDDFSRNRRADKPLIRPKRSPGYMVDDLHAYFTDDAPELIQVPASSIEHEKAMEEPKSVYTFKKGRLASDSTKPIVHKQDEHNARLLEFLINSIPDQ